MYVPLKILQIHIQLEESLYAEEKSHEGTKGVLSCNLEILNSRIYFHPSLTVQNQKTVETHIIMNSLKKDVDTPVEYF